MKQRELARVKRDESRKLCDLYFAGEFLCWYVTERKARETCRRLNREISAHVAAMLKRGLNKELDASHVKGGGKQVRK